jgi:hypothetical protein
MGQGDGEFGGCASRCDFVPFRSDGTEGVKVNPALRVYGVTSGQLSSVAGLPSRSEFGALPDTETVHRRLVGDETRRGQQTADTVTDSDCDTDTVTEADSDTISDSDTVSDSNRRQSAGPRVTLWSTLWSTVLTTGGRTSDRDSSTSPGFASDEV